MKVKILKLLLVVIFALSRGHCLLAADAGHEAVVMLSGNSVDLKAATASGGNPKTPKWAGHNNQKILVGTYPASDTWQQDSLTFIPSSDGTVSMTLRGPRIKTSADSDELISVFMDFDGISVEGATIINGSFEEDAPSDVPRGWQYYVPSDNKTPITDSNRAHVKEGDAAQGSKFIRVWHNSTFAITFKVTSDRPVTIGFYYREAPTP